MIRITNADFAEEGQASRSLLLVVVVRCLLLHVIHMKEGMKHNNMEWNGMNA